MSHVRPFRTLVVCTGNVCRSPMVERVLQSRLDHVSPGAFEISSAGTSALVGSEMTPEIAEIVRSFDASEANFASRQLTGQVLADQDLVLALTRDHRATVLELAPRLLRRTFTLREFGRMVRFLITNAARDVEFPVNTYDRWTRLIPVAASVRHRVLGDPEDDDVVDPFRRDLSIHREMVSQVRPPLEALAEFESTYAPA